MLQKASFKFHSLAYCANLTEELWKMHHLSILSVELRLILGTSAQGAGLFES